MIIELLGDIHLDSVASPRKDDMSRRRGMENYAYVPKPLGYADAYVIPGDIGPWDEDSRPFLAAFAEEHGKPVIFVPGNHEFERGYPIDHRFNSPHDLVHVLQFGETLVMDDICFIGATLWTGPEITDRTRRLAEGFIDFEHVRSPVDAHRLMSLDEYVAQHHRERDAILKQCWWAHYVEGKTPVVITHHAPSFTSTPMRFTNDALNIFFASDMTEAIHQLVSDEAAPPVWMHAHIHDACDYRIRDTRVINQPLGYRGDSETTSWRPIEIIKKKSA